MTKTKKFYVVISDRIYVENQPEHIYRTMFYGGEGEFVEDIEEAEKFDSLKDAYRAISVDVDKYKHLDDVRFVDASVEYKW